MNLSPGKRLWALFTSSTDEVAGDPLMAGSLRIASSPGSATWCSGLGLRDDVELVIKVHPNLGGNRYIGKAVDELRIYQEMKAGIAS